MNAIVHTITSLLLRRFKTGSRISSVFILLQPNFSEANVKTVKENCYIPYILSIVVVYISIQQAKCK